MWAASLVPDHKVEERPPTFQFLESQVERLETELAEKDARVSRVLRTMEQQCHQAKVRLTVATIALVVHQLSPG